MTNHYRKSAAEIAALVTAREITAREVAEDALARIDAVNPAINAVVQHLPEQALAEADRVDAMIAQGGDPGPLAGVPTTIKVNTDQEGMASTNGLRIQKDLIAEQDNPVVANLRKAGAVIVGRTNTPAFSLRWFCRNSLHGHTKNPRDPARTPGGSSGGAASAVAAGIGALAHGTDIAGSVRYPAYACGVHGLRTTLGRVPAVNFTSGDRQIGAQVMAVSGPLARTIEDVELGFHAMAAEDLRDPWWVPVPVRLPELPKRAALCVAPDGMQTAPEVEAALHKAARALTDAGWMVTEIDATPPVREAALRNVELWMAEYQSGAGQAILDEDDPDANHVYAMLSEIAAPPDVNGLLDTLHVRASLVRDWQMFLADHTLLLCPVSGELPFPDLLDVESAESFRRCFEAQLLQVGTPFMGLPGLTVSTGLVGTVPVGMQLVGGRYREDVLLDAGRIIEAAGTPPMPCDPSPA
ncbi:MAG: amidase family protein [Pseudomonadota bacterium]